MNPKNEKQSFVKNEDMLSRSELKTIMGGTPTHYFEPDFCPVCSTGTMCFIYSTQERSACMCDNGEWC